MKKFNLRSFAAMVLMAVGTVSASAESASATVKMTYVDYGNADTSFGIIADGESAKSGFNSVDDGSVGFGNTSWGANYITIMEVDASAVGGTITKATLTADCSGSTDSRRITEWGVGVSSLITFSETLTYNAVAGKLAITTIGSKAKTSSKSATTFKNLTFDITDALKDVESKKAVLVVYETAAAGGYIKNPVVTVEYTTAALVNYTVEYVVSDSDTPIKSVTKQSVSGVSPELEAADIANFDYDGVAYIVDSNNASEVTVSEDGTTKVTVVCHEAQEVKYIVKSNLGADLSSGTALEQATVDLYFPRYYLDGTKLYGRAFESKDGYFRKTVTLSSAAEQTIVIDGYSESKNNVVYFKEAEDIEGFNGFSGSNANIRCSNGKAGQPATANTNVLLTTLDKGVYHVYSSTWGGATNTYTVKIDGGADIVSMPTTGSIQDYDASFNVVDNGSAIVVSSDKKNKDRGIDFIYIVKEGDLTEFTGTITDAGYATFSNSSDVQITGAEVYTAKLNDTQDKLMMTKVEDGIVPANTGVILKGNGEFTVTYTTSAATLDSDLKPTTASTVGNRLIYVLSNGDDGVCFYKLQEGVATGIGKAYIERNTSSGAKPMTFCFAGDITSADEVVAEKDADAAGKEEMYNLAGQRIAKAKGIVVTKGRRFFVK